MAAKTEEELARKAKRKQERKELRNARKLERRKYLEDMEDKDPLTLKEWLSLDGIRAEMKNVHWPRGKELAVDSAVVLAFTIVLGLYFYASDAVIAVILKALGMS